MDKLKRKPPKFFDAIVYKSRNCEKVQRDSTKHNSDLMHFLEKDEKRIFKASKKRRIRI